MRPKPARPLGAFLEVLLGELCDVTEALGAAMFSIGIVFIPSVRLADVLGQFRFHVVWL